MSWSRFWRRSYWDRERAAELQAYLEEETANNLARGMDADEARRAAHRRLGNVTLLREEIYQMNTIGWIDALWRDLRYGARLLRRNPAFTAVAILTLALGTGANTAMFQLVDAVRLRTLPVESPQELVEIRIAETPNGRTGHFMGRRPLLTFALWERIRTQQTGFSSVMSWSATTFDLAAGGEVRPADGLWVSGSFFRTLGVAAALGRVLTEADDQPGCAMGAAVISYPFWQREFAGDRGVLGRTLLLDGHRVEVVGITPASFFGVEVGRTFDIAVPLCTERIIRGEQNALDRSDAWFLAAIGRLERGWSRDRASTQLAAISPGIFRETLPARYGPRDVRDYLGFRLAGFPASTGVSSLRRTYERPLWILLAATGVVLLIVCANLANLMLTRATAREREIAVRLAIGASRRRIVRQLLSEGVLIATIGAAAGLLLARWLSGLLVRLLSTGNSPLFVDLALDWRVFAFTAAVAALACLLFGLAPAVRATAESPASAMKPGARGASEGGERFALRRALVVAQVALSLVLVVGALLFVRTFRNLATVDGGFRADNVLVVTMDFQRAGVPEASRRALYTEVVERLRSVPGVIDAAEAFIVPISGSGWTDRILIGGAEQPGIVNVNSVGPRYFRVLRTALAAGRDFTGGDTAASPRVAIVNETFARKYFARRSPLGQSFQIATPPGAPRPSYQIVGLAKDTKYRDLREEMTPIVHLAATQEANPDPALQVLLRLDVPASGVSPAVTAVLRGTNPSIAVQFETLDHIVRESLVTERVMAALSGLFGILAMVIATVGLYGVMSYMVARRRVEIGIRIALGAGRAQTVRAIVREAATLVVLGLAAGIALALVSTRAAAALLYEVQPSDPATLIAAAAGLGAVATLASWIPAWRAARVDPTIALRQE